MSDTSVTDRDIRAIKSYDWPRRALGTAMGFREPEFQVVFHQSVLDQIHLHGQSATDVEVCGVLIGTGYNDAHGPYLLIEHCIRGKATNGQSTNVTFTAETWQHIQEAMDRDYPDKKMVGWYHTHPGFGIFLSDMDTFICENFFNLPWQVAFVYDPHSGEEGNFVWRAGKTKREPVLIEDNVTGESASIPLISVASATGGGEEPTIDNEKIIELLVRVQRLEKRQKLMIVAMAFLAAFVAMWAYEFTPSSAPAGRPTTMPVIGNPVPLTPLVLPSRHRLPPVDAPVTEPSTQPML